MDLRRKAHASDNLIAVAKDAAIADCLRQYCERHQIEGATIRLCDDPLSDAPTIINGGAATLLIEAGPAGETTLARLESLNQRIAGKGSIIVILDNPDAQTLRQLFRAGVTDVLPTPVSDAEIVAALDAARRSLLSNAPGGKIVTVMKSAGGVGATTVAVNAAREMRDLSGARVALIDLDLQFGTDGLALDIQPRMDITDAIRASERLDDTLLRSLMTRHKSGLDVLPAAPAITPLDVISEDFAKSFIRQLRASYDFAVLEMPTAWSHWFGAVFDETDILAPVVETSVRSADGSSRIMQGLSDLAIRNQNLFVVANRFVKKPESKERLAKLADIYGTKAAALVRADDKTATDASDLGKCVKDIAPAAPLAEDFKSLGEKLLDRLGASVAAAAEPRNADPLRRLLPGVMQKLGEKR